MRRPELVASDVDGTLLDPLGRVTDRTKAVIGRLRASGIPFVLATGRPPRWLGVAADVLELTGPAVCCNGAIVYDLTANEILLAEELDPVLLREVGDALGEALPGSGYAVERAAATGGEPVFLAEQHYRNPWGDERSTVAPRAELLGRPVVKLLVRNEDLSSEEMATVARGLVGDSVEVTYSTGLGLIECSVTGVSKATGLAFVAERAGVAAADVLAFGDMHNDLEMLRWAGHGVAMGNGHADVHAVADEVGAGNAEEGVAEILERWF